MVHFQEQIWSESIIKGMVALRHKCFGVVWGSGEIVFVDNFPQKEYNFYIIFLTKNWKMWRKTIGFLEW